MNSVFILWTRVVKEPSQSFHVPLLGRVDVKVGHLSAINISQQAALRRIYDIQTVL